MVPAHDVFCSPEEEFRIQVAEIVPNLYPIVSMYGIFIYIYHKNQPLQM